MVVNVNGVSSNWTIALFRTITTQTCYTRPGSPSGQSCTTESTYHRLRALCFTVNSALQATGGCAPGDGNGSGPADMTTCDQGDFIDFQDMGVEFAARTTLTSERCNARVAPCSLARRRP